LRKRTTEIVIQFRRTPFVLFRNTSVKNLETNRLVIHIQPEEGISLSFGAKVPGSVMKLGLVNMDFDYTTLFRIGAQQPAMSGCCAIAWPVMPLSFSDRTWSKPDGM